MRNNNDSIKRIREKSFHGRQTVKDILLDENGADALQANDDTAFNQKLVMIKK